MSGSAAILAPDVVVGTPLATRSVRPRGVCRVGASRRPGTREADLSDIENPDYGTYKHFGWGLQMEQDSGMGNWIHLPVPTKAGGTWGRVTSG